METRRTPGPWETYQPPLGGEIAIYPVSARSDNPTGRIATVRDPDHARLIAAAPETAAERDRLREINAELLAALEAILRRVESLSWLAKSQEIAKARAAIAKARGE